MYSYSVYIPFQLNRLMKYASTNPFTKYVYIYKFQLKFISYIQTLYICIYTNEIIT